MVTGAAGALGTDLVRVLTADGERFHAYPRADLDIADAEAVEAAVAGWAGGADEPCVLLNAAAYTAVDLAETDEQAARTAHAVNAEAPGLLAAACARHGARLVHVSTDYVFDGRGPDGRPGAGYEPDDPTGARSVYGRTKEEGERRVREALDAHHVVRTAWVYGDTGSNFVATMARLAAQRDTLDVVDDQHGSPTWSADLAAALVALGRSDAPAGTLHATGGGATTWCGFARAVFAELGADPDRVRGCTTDQFPRPAPRPAWSVLSPASWTAAGLAPLRDWREALHEAVTRHPGLLGR
ncbi:dTDP-4-dehydrorhamnose reductase [Actinomycetospora sp. OC33-EN08]|uniref:dTDP-4-dehydrorhamnose reductase n=1 Tax=Actinomycetospora aurantiaca TaxID=3129233 RepID=A0ABU8MWZ6_9PSEU